MGEASKADAQAGVTMMVVAATSNRVIRSRCTPGSSTSRPHGGDSSHNSRMAAAVSATAAISAVTTRGTVASANQPLGQLGETTSPAAVQPLDQLGDTTSPKAVPERSASPAETTPSGKR